MAVIQRRRAMLMLARVVLAVVVTVVTVSAVAVAMQGVKARMRALAVVAVDQPLAIALAAWPRQKSLQALRSSMLMTTLLWLLTMPLLLLPQLAMPLALMMPRALTLKQLRIVPPAVAATKQALPLARTTAPMLLHQAVLLTTVLAVLKAKGLMPTPLHRLLTQVTTMARQTRGK